MISETVFCLRCPGEVEPYPQSSGVRVTAELTVTMEMFTTTSKRMSATVVSICV